MTATTLPHYIQGRGYYAGIPNKVSFYSIRRRMATDLATAFGLDAAREIMGHDPNTRTLEESYLESNAMRHITAVGLGEDVTGQDRERRAALHHQLLRRLNENLVEKSRGEALNCMVRTSLDADEGFAKLENEGDIKRYARNTRIYCFKVLWK